MILLSTSILVWLFAFSPAVTTNGSVTLSIADIPPVTALEQEIPVHVTLTNDGIDPVRGSVRLDVIDRWRVVGEVTHSVELPPKASQELAFRCVAGKGTHAAHYPIHATAMLETAAGEDPLHTVLVVEVLPEAIASLPVDREPRPLVLKAPGRLSLLSLEDAHVSFQVGEEGALVRPPPGWSGSDPKTGTSVQRLTVQRGDRRSAIGVHPPWKTGWGRTWIDYDIALPNARPIVLDFATAIRDHVPGREPPSDGVQFEVWVASGKGGAFRLVFDRFSDAKRWEEARIDLSDYVGQRIQLRLLTDPGPAHDTTCDQSYWADPVVLAGIEPRPAEGEAELQERRRQAQQQATLAAEGTATPDARPLRPRMGFGIAPGPHGIVDAALSFATPAGTLTFDGFHVEIDDRRVGSWRSGFRYGALKADEDTWTLPIQDGDRRFELMARVWTEAGGVRIRWALQGIERDARGHPRLTHISLGPADRQVYRLYAGHGNVLREPGALRLPYNGFNLSTSFAGFDFDNGVSLVQATDLPPDALVHDPERRIASLEAHHDLTFTLVSSIQGAFEAARQYRAIARLTPAAGVKKLTGKMCLDQWGGDYARAARDIERAARYGLTDAVFVKHVWQRWGYDYRLPDIYPPAGRWEDFLDMVEACKRNGILFAPHDNYIDFYPDATDFSYRHVIFNADGTPQRAWYNRGRDAQSYRWLSHAFQPWMERNLALIREGFAPTAYFIDVFSAITPRDYYDEAEMFYPKTLSVQKWGETFDRVRAVLNGAPTISEAGHDALVGHLDAAEADHAGWTREGGGWKWNIPAADGERVPWHDMVTHGSFILFAGGLGNRYAGEDTSRAMHGYGSDDYLSMTVLGGRNPMCDGPFNRRAVMTYWLLHDVCAELAKREMTDHQFADANIHRQIVHFGEDGRVVVNRDPSVWTFEGHALPQYGFLAEVGDRGAMISQRDGVVTAYAEGPETIFADARPPEHFGGIPLHVEILGVEPLGGRRFALKSRWVVQSPLQEPGRTFIHFTNEAVAPEGEHIAFQAQFPIGPEQWRQIGIYEVNAEAELPSDLPLGSYGIRFGIYQPEQGGRRLTIPGPRDATGRSRGGSLRFKTGEANNLEFEYRPAAPDEATQRLNLARVLVDFGPLMTNGAFRLLRQSRLLIPLPGSADFEVILKLDALGFPSIQRVEALNEDFETLHEVEIHTQGDLLHFTGEQGIFAYRLVP